MSARRPKHDPFDFVEVNPPTLSVDPDADAGTRCWLSSRYQVTAYPQAGGWLWLSIKRRDKLPVHDWREFQQIKNVLCGPEREAVELYPAESRVVDTSNQYHLWVLPLGERFPLGWTERAVIDGDGSSAPGRSRQRPLPPYMKPTHTEAEAREAVAAIRAGKVPS